MYTRSTTKQRKKTVQLGNRPPGTETAIKATTPFNGRKKAGWAPTIKSTRNIDAPDSAFFALFDLNAGPSYAPNLRASEEGRTGCIHLPKRR